MSTDCNCLLLLSGSGLENAIFSVFPERRKASAFKGIPTNVYVWSTATRSASRGLPTTSLTHHEAIFIFQLLLGGDTLPFLSLNTTCLSNWWISYHPLLLPDALPDAPNPAALPDSSGSGALGLGFSISAHSQCHFCPSNTANLFQQTRHWTHPLLGKLTWGWHWHFVGHKRGSGVSRCLPRVLMAFKVPSHQNLVMRDKICCSESVEHVRSGMNWDFPQRTSIAQNQFWEVSSHCLRTPWLLKILWSHMPPKSTPRFLFV